MFDFVQKYRRAMQVVLGLIAITFATWGIESYTRFTGGRDAVASVNGSDISRREFDEQLRVQQEGLRRMFGGQLDPAAFDNPETRRAVLEQMVNERLVATETAKRNLWFNDKRLSEAILAGAMLEGAVYDEHTHFPAGFVPATAGMRKGD